MLPNVYADDTTDTDGCAQVDEVVSGRGNHRNLERGFETYVEKELCTVEKVTLSHMLSVNVYFCIHFVTALGLV